MTEKFGVPTLQDLDLRLIGGSAMFGIGWGLAGFCPGPGISALALGYWKPAIFVAAMLAGMFLFRLIPSPTPPRVGAGV